MYRGRLILGFCVMLLLASCGDSTDVNQPGRVLPPNGISIVIGAQSRGPSAFSPNPLTLSLANTTGGSVQWFNDDRTDNGYSSTAVIHNIAADDGSFSSGELAPGNTFETPLAVPGTYRYHCSIHPTMRGEVTITP
jgi:plastocyanin